jgi:two-component system, OmpR family, sensor histidine kinase VanS
VSDQTRGPDPEPTRIRRRLTARTRLTVICSALIAASTSILLAVVWLVMRYLPTYAIGSTLPAGRAAERGAPEAPAPTSFPVEPVPNASGSVGLRSVTGDTVLITSASDVLNTLLLSSGLVIVPIVAIGALASWIVAGRLLRPVHDLTAAARRAADGSLEHRLALTGPRDEFREMADTFDEMLGRLERSFGVHQRFAANASHELRTPLATSKALLDVAARRPDRVELAQLLPRLQQTNAECIRIVTSLLDLTEAARDDLDREPVRLDDLATRILAGHASEIDASGLRLSSSLAEVTVSANEPLLERAVTNLLLNALRHNVEGGWVSVETRVSEGLRILSVENSGDGSADDVVPLLAEPMFRARGRVFDAGRTGRQRGHGLGLTLVANIAAAHGADLDLQPNVAGGLCVTLAFSAASADI